MSLDTLSEVNYGAVAVAALVFFALGALWYAPAVFGKAWMNAMGAEVGQQTAFNPLLYVATYVAWFVVALAMGFAGLLMGIDTGAEGVGLGFLFGIGIMVPVEVVGSIYEKRSARAQTIGAGYNLVGFVLMGLILGLWT
ncbi:MAG TPA: DUF1761 domain-containing protein [Actinomycetota bacterium]